MSHRPDHKGTLASDLKGALSRFINPMLPSRLVLVVYVCECVWACRLISADQRSSWFNHHHHQLQLITPPLNTHHFLISFVRSLFVSPGCVWSRLRSSLVPSSFLFVFLWICHSGFVTSHQHFYSRHSSDHRSPCATTLFLFGQHLSSSL